MFFLNKSNLGNSAENNKNKTELLQKITGGEINAINEESNKLIIIK